MCCCVVFTVCIKPHAKKKRCVYVLLGKRGSQRHFTEVESAGKPEVIVEEKNPNKSVKPDPA